MTAIAGTTFIYPLFFLGEYLGEYTAEVIILGNGYLIKAQITHKSYTPIDN